MNIDYSMELACTPAHLWPYLEQPELQKQWMKGLEENISTSDNPRCEGATFRMKIKEGGKTSEYDGRVTAFDENRHLGISMWGGSFPPGMTLNVDYRLTELLGRTHLDYQCQMDSPKLGFWMRLFMPLGACFARMQLRSFMKKLKALAEQPA